MNKKIFGLICLSLICSSYSIRTSHMESSSELHDLSDLSEPIEADSEVKIAEENETIQPIEADEITQSIEEPEAVQPIEAGLFGIDNSPAPMKKACKNRHPASSIQLRLGREPFILQEKPFEKSMEMWD
jgi:hypothetical protein